MQAFILWRHKMIILPFIGWLGSRRLQGHFVPSELGHNLRPQNHFNGRFRLHF